MTTFTPTTIETGRLLLRPMQAGDFDALLEILTDPRGMASFGGEIFTPAQLCSYRSGSA